MQIKMNLSNLAKKHKKNHNWPMEKKIAAVAQYLVLGNMALVAASTGIDAHLLRHWKMQPWWADTEREIRATENLGIDNKLSKIVDRSLDVVQDRLENGDFIYNQKTGQIVRKPVSIKDAVSASKEMLTKRELLRGNATERKEQTTISMADQLKHLAHEFAKLNQQTTPLLEDVTDVEVKLVNEDEVVHDTEPTDEVYFDDGEEEASEPHQEVQAPST
jgi:hypothetical protein